MLPTWLKFQSPGDRGSFYTTPSQVPRSADLAHELEVLIDTTRHEEDIQHFFERYPHFLPGLDHYHNGPVYDLVVAKLPLGIDFITDFAFISQNSQTARLTCVELESPHKKIFRNDGSFSRHYLDAKQQIADWNMWAQEHLRDAINLFGPMSRHVTPRIYDLGISLECVLIIGRQANIRTRKEHERWSSEAALRQASMQIMTYDRVLAKMRSGWHWPLDKRMLVCSYTDRQFYVKRVAI